MRDDTKNEKALVQKAVALLWKVSDDLTGDVLLRDVMVRPGEALLHERALEQPLCFGEAGCRKQETNPSCHSVGICTIFLNMRQGSVR